MLSVCFPLILSIVFFRIRGFGERDNLDNLALYFCTDFVACCVNGPAEANNYIEIHHPMNRLHVKKQKVCRGGPMKA